MGEAAEAAIAGFGVDRWKGIVSSSVAFCGNSRTSFAGMSARPTIFAGAEALSCDVRCLSPDFGKLSQRAMHELYAD
jgi:hypothetical protein